MRKQKAEESVNTEWVERIAVNRLESALLKHTIKSTVHTSESEYRGSRVYPKSVISQINRGSLIHLTTETY